MLPCLPQDDLADHGLTNPELGTEGFLSNASFGIKQADSTNFSRGHLGFHQPTAECVEVIFLGRDPFKVPSASVQFVGVNVVNEHPFRACSQKSLSDKNMNCFARDDAVTPQTDEGVEVLASAQLGLKNIACATGTQPSFDAPHSSEARDFVEAFVTNNGTPFFGGGSVIVHRESKPFSGAMRAAVPSGAPA